MWLLSSRYFHGVSNFFWLCGILSFPQQIYSLIESRLVCFFAVCFSRTNRVEGIFILFACSCQLPHRLDPHLLVPFLKSRDFFGHALQKSRISSSFESQKAKLILRSSVCLNSWKFQKFLARSQDFVERLAMRMKCWTLFWPLLKSSVASRSPFWSFCIRQRGPAS